MTMTKLMLLTPTFQVTLTEPAFKGLVEVARSLRGSMMTRAQLEAQMIQQGATAEQINWVRMDSDEAARTLDWIEQVLATAASPSSLSETPGGSSDSLTSTDDPPDPSEVN